MGFLLLLGLACCQFLITQVGMTSQPQIFPDKVNFPLAETTAFCILKTNFECQIWANSIGLLPTRKPNLISGRTVVLDDYESLEVGICLYRDFGVDVANDSKIDAFTGAWVILYAFIASPDNFMSHASCYSLFCYSVM